MKEQMNSAVDAGPITLFQYPGDPTEEQIEEWKKRFGDVFMTVFEDVTFYWRLLSRPEYKEEILGERMDPFTREERTCALCVLWPENFPWDTSKAGYASLVSENIFDASGFVASAKPIKL